MPITGSFGHNSPGLGDLSQLRDPPTWEQIHDDPEWSALFWAWLTDYRQDTNVGFWQDASYLAFDSGGDTATFLTTLNNLYPSEEWNLSGCQIIADATAVFQEEEGDPTDWRSLTGPELVTAVSGKAERQPDKSMDYTVEVQRLWTYQIAEVLSLFHQHCQQLTASTPATPQAAPETPEAPAFWQTVATGLTETETAERAEATEQIGAVEQAGTAEPASQEDMSTQEIDTSDTVDITNTAHKLKITEEELIAILNDEEKRERLIAALLKSD